MTGYLIVYRDYEGCEVKSLHDFNTIMGAFNNLISKNKDIRNLYKTMVTELLPDIEDQDNEANFFEKRSELEEKYLDKCEEQGIDSLIRFDDPTRYCIMKADENGALCACAEFGIKGRIIYS